MLKHPTRRKHGRFVPDPQATISFRYAGRRISGIPVLDLSASGCQVLLPPALSFAGVSLALLDGLEIHHPIIPPLDLRGVVVHRTEKGRSGIEFLGVPKEMYFLLQSLARNPREH